MAAEPPVKLDYKSRRLVGQIVEYVKSQGIFDQFRRDCIEELEQKESYRQLTQRVESHVATFLSKQTWSDALPKNQVRDSLRKHINQSEVLDRGVKQLISQALESKSKAFQTRIEGVVQNYIYMQKHPQNQDKQNRKRKIQDEKEENKPSVPEVICDISQFIPVPSTAGSKNESHGAEKGKLGLQESSSKSAAAAKGTQPVKKSYLTQGKASSLAAKGEETKPGSPSCRKEQTEESSRTKEGKNRMSRVKVESLSRDEHSQTLTKSEESAHKLKDDKTKISRVKLENYNPTESVSSSLAVDSGSSNAQDGNTNPLTGTQSLVPSQLCQTAEETDGSSQVDVTRLLQVKSEKTNESESSVFSYSEDKVQVKAEGSGTSGIKIEVESSESDILLGLEKIVDDSETERRVKVMDDEISKPDAGIQRSDYSATSTVVEEIKDDGVAEKNAGEVILDEKNVKTLEGEGKLESLKESELGEKMETMWESKSEDIKDLETESDIRKRNAFAADVCKERSVDLPATRDVDEPEEKFLSIEKVGVTEMTSVNEKSQVQSLSDERGLLSWQRDGTVRSEPISNKVEVESIERENTGHTSSTDEHSDVESDISEVSSVHTSDLSSFDDEISSSSEFSYEQNEEARETNTNEEPEKSEAQQKSNTQPQTEQASDAAPMRRSTRIISRRSTKEGESETSGGEGSKLQTESHRQRKRGEKRERKAHSKTSKERSDYSTGKRKRGRPRKEEARASSHSGNQRRRSRILDREGSSLAARRSGSGEERSKRSQRQIKRTRCYSPSSEGTREVFLPRKRSRDSNS